VSEFSRGRSAGRDVFLLAYSGLRLVIHRVACFRSTSMRAMVARMASPLTRGGQSFLEVHLKATIAKVHKLLPCRRFWASGAATAPRPRPALFKTLRLNIGLASFGPTSAYPSLDLSRLFHVALHELEALQAPRRLGGLASLARLDVE
jgi:hypothetical protein